MGDFNLKCRFPIQTEMLFAIEILQTIRLPRGDGAKTPTENEASHAFDASDELALKTSNLVREAKTATNFACPCRMAGKKKKCRP